MIGNTTAKIDNGNNHHTPNRYQLNNSRANKDHNATQMKIHVKPAVELNASEANKKLQNSTMPSKSIHQFEHNEKQISFMLFVIKVMLGICIHIGNRFTVHELYGSSSNNSGSAHNLLILPNFPSTIFTFAVLLYVARIEWINENYFRWIPHGLRMICNIGIALALTEYLLKTLWIIVITLVKYVFTLLEWMIANLMDDQQQLGLIKCWSQGNESTTCFSWCTAAIFLIFALDHLRKSWNCSTRTIGGQAKRLQPKSILKASNRPARCICR